MRIRLVGAIIAFSVATGVAWATTAGAGYASLVATTGGATSVARTSAILNGVALTLNPSSAWVFQYGTTGVYGNYSRGSAVGLGLTAVSATVGDLAPSTTYHFRLVVVQGSPANAGDYSTGNEVTFTTAPAAKPASPYGKTSVPSHHPSIHRGVLSIPFRCHGRHGMVCNGTISGAVRNARGNLVRCGTANFRASAGHALRLESEARRACRRVLRKAHGQAMPAALSAALSGKQSSLSRPW